MKNNNSLGKPYYSQRNNVLKPEGACNVTAMVSALSAAGWPVEKFSDEKYKQPEDALMHFILADPVIDREWHRIDPPSRYAPNEWHPLLATGANMLLRKCRLLAPYETAVVFGENRSLADFTAAIDAGGAAVVSGLFETQAGRVIGHVVSLVGYKKDSTGKLSSFIIDDPWGDYRTKYANANGDDIEMPVADFMRIMKPRNASHKFGHIVRAYKA
jgi:hypothetical protein|nr:MAG TPA: peptidase [Caudoviricetes sp.]